MIARLVGTVADVSGDDVVLDVNGVGYAVGVPLRNAQELKEGDACTVWVHTVVREDALLLYGFLSREDKAVFEQLIGVSGIGPRVGLNALGKFTAQALALAIESNDLRSLASIPAVGKKTAERIVLELRGKLCVAPVAQSGVASPAAPVRTVDDTFAIALAQLGYKRTEIDMAAARLKADGLDDKPIGERITAALRVLSGSAYARPARTP
ncbi:MAG: Holliday junction branch migration protein RuvA [Myxococcales bacterium]|nr:Holliday junction branch migration protein RuvA [Myxococcales bacterium]